MYYGYLYKLIQTKLKISIYFSPIKNFLLDNELIGYNNNSIITGDFNAEPIKIYEFVELLLFYNLIKMQNKIII